MSRRPVVHQFTAVLAGRDAVGQHTLALDDLLVEMGAETTIFAAHVHPEVGDRGRDFREHPDAPAPDLIISSIGADLFACPLVTIEAVVENVGDAGAPAGIPVAFYEGLLPNPTFIGTAMPSVPILPGQSLLVAHDWTMPAARAGEVLIFYAAVDDDGSATPGAGNSVAGECVENNNLSEPEITECPRVE